MTDRRVGRYEHDLQPARGVTLGVLLGVAMWLLLVAGWGLWEVMR